ncbi:hypothetical protein B0T25DRAFT_608862 [Lasiosphaeria hispida]|uniref:Uncharacterized protein n=1 Tax=Lasiosphaeria hispida TaxID=260671 RepID=A0AAJ0MBK1_9PEZI|nr:hypothetical protein B0T25DRAFT_608862 [Lasiosphaeria hispida]
MSFQIAEFEVTTGLAPPAAKCLVWHSRMIINPRRRAHAFYKYFVVLHFVDAEGGTLWKTEVWYKAGLGDLVPGAPAFAMEVPRDHFAIGLGSTLPRPHESISTVTIRRYLVGSRSFCIKDGRVVEITPPPFKHQSLIRHARNPLACFSRPRPVFPRTIAYPTHGWIGSPFPVFIIGTWCIHWSSHLGRWLYSFKATHAQSPDATARQAAMDQIQQPASGFNPLHGLDMGPPPPSDERGTVAVAAPPAHAPPATPMMIASPPAGPPPGSAPPTFTFPPVQALPASPYAHPLVRCPGDRFYYMPTATPMPAPAMPIAGVQGRSSLPGINFINSTGGIGCEQGYNYLFPREHTKIHVLNTVVAPWLLDPAAPIEVAACHVPASMTMLDLVFALGATVPEKARICEVVKGGEGKWYPGLKVFGDRPAEMRKTCKEMGWDSGRTGEWGQRDVVYVYLEE